MRTGNFVQRLASFIVTTPFALAFEHESFDGNVPLIGALAWSVLGLSQPRIDRHVTSLRSTCREGSAWRIATPHGNFSRARCGHASACWSGSPRG